MKLLFGLLFLIFCSTGYLFLFLRQGKCITATYHMYHTNDTLCQLFNHQSLLFCWNIWFSGETWSKLLQQSNILLRRGDLLIETRLSLYILIFLLILLCIILCLQHIILLSIVIDRYVLTSITCTSIDPWYDNFVLFFQNTLYDSIYPITYCWTL